MADGRIRARVQSAAGRVREATGDRSSASADQLRELSREEAIEAIRRARERGAPVADEPTSKEVVKRAGRAGMCGAPMNATLEPLTAPGENAKRMVGVGSGGMAPVDNMLVGGGGSSDRDPRGRTSEDSTVDSLITGGESDGGNALLSFDGDGDGDAMLSFDGDGDDDGMLSFGGDY